MNLPELFDCPAPSIPTRISAVGCEAYQSRVRRANRSAGYGYQSMDNGGRDYPCPEDCPRWGSKEGEMSQIRAAEDKAALGGEIKQMRTRLGWTSAKLAAESGISIGTISKIEQGKSQPKPETLAKIERAFKGRAGAGGLGDGGSGQRAEQSERPDERTPAPSGEEATPASDGPGPVTGEEETVTCARCGREDPVGVMPGEEGPDALPVDWERIMISAIATAPHCPSCAHEVTKAQGARLRGARWAKGMSTQNRRLLDLEEGRSGLNPERLHKLARDYGVNPLWIATGKGPREEGETVTCARCGREDPVGVMPGEEGPDALPVDWREVLIDTIATAPFCPNCSEKRGREQGSRAKEARRAARLTTRQAAEEVARVGLLPPQSGETIIGHLSAVEHGRKALNAKLLHLLARIYGVGPKWIVTGEGQKPKIQPLPMTPELESKIKEAQAIAREADSAEVSPAEKEGLVGEIRSFEPEKEVKFNLPAHVGATPARFYYCGPASGLAEALDRFEEMVKGRQAA